MKQLTLSTFPQIKNTSPSTITQPLDIVVKGLLTPLDMVQDKSRLPLWSPAKYSGTRCIANTVSIDFLVYDIDDGIAPQSAWLLFKDHAVMVHSSYSHSAAHHKYRVIIPLAESIPVNAWSFASYAAYQYWETIVGRGEPDLNALKDPSRAYYRYSKQSNLHNADYSPGPLFKLDYGHVSGHDIANWKPIKQEIKKKEPIIRKKRRVLRAKARNTRDLAEQQYRRPDNRLMAAHRLGAKIVGNEARYITCPQCSRNSVHFSIDINLPSSTLWPKCNHKSCSFYSSLVDLVGGYNE